MRTVFVCNLHLLPIIGGKKVIITFNFKIFAMSLSELLSILFDDKKPELIPIPIPVNNDQQRK